VTGKRVFLTCSRSLKGVTEEWERPTGHFAGKWIKPIRRGNQGGEGDRKSDWHSENGKSEKHAYGKRG